PVPAGSSLHPTPPSHARLAPSSPVPRLFPPSLPAHLRAPSLPPPTLRAPGTRSRTLRRLHQSRAGGSAEQPLLPPPRWSSVSPPGSSLPVPVPWSPFLPSFLLPLQPLLALSLWLQSLSGPPPGGQEGGGVSTMSDEGSNRCSRVDHREAQPSLPTPPPPPPPGEPALVPTSPRYRPPLPSPPERTAGSGEPPLEVAPRRKGEDERLPSSLLPREQEVSAAGDSCEGRRRLPEVAVPEKTAEKGGPGELEAGACGEGERRGTGDQPETRSVCSSRSSSSGGGGDQRSGHHHQHHQPICKICFQGAEQGELLNPCRCDGSVRYTHQLCLLKWISERGSWTCELCCYRYHVTAIKMKQPCQVDTALAFPGVFLLMRVHLTFIFP
ncbi:E3 ubiquitin-protein ligase MARCHF11, partial [Lemmus lemmus]